MDKTLQDLAWSVLLKEFKEEVKETYREYTEKIATKSEPEYRIVGYIAAHTELELLFGEHNLTSDADGEEMLSVSRRRVQELYNRYFGNPLEPVSKLRLRKDLQDLFGSKCLPIEEDPKSAKPKFKVGDKVRISCAYKNGEIWDNIIHGRVVTIKSIYRNATNNYIWMYQFEEEIRDFSEGWLSLYPDQEYEKGNLPTIDDRRLNIAAMILSGLLASGKDKHPVKRALELTDSIIAE